MENGGNIVSCLTPNDYYWAFSHYSKAFGSQERKREREREKKPAMKVSLVFMIGYCSILQP